MNKLFWFPDPLDKSTGVLRSDVDGLLRNSQSDIHPSGRKGISWDVSSIGFDKNGARVTISNPDDYYDLSFRGILDLHYNGEIAGLIVDDCQLIKKPPSPTPPQPQPPASNKAIDIINEVFNEHQFNLATKDGCGKFTEECCKRLHERNSPQWGHLRKSGAQNQYNGHAVDAIQLLVNSFDTTAGIYDIITDSESPNAKPALNFASNADPGKWYYPA